jgi:DNA-binding MarR family transcriptional regulator
MDDRVGYVLKKVQAALRGKMDEVLHARGLTTPQYAVLSALEREPGLSNAELARRSFVTPQTMLRILENLGALGLLAREPHPTHGRVQQVELTAKGKRLVAGCHHGVLAVEQRMLKGLSPTERHQLLELLARCAQSLA